MKTTRCIALATLTLFAACSVESSEEPAGSPAPADEPALEEPLPTPEEEAAKAAQVIDEANADAELQRLQQELGGG